VMHRDRRRGIRRVLEVAELIPTAGVKQIGIELNVIFRWIAADDTIAELAKSYRAISDIKLYAGMGADDIRKDLEDKKKVLKWLVRNNVKDIHEVGRIVSEYYRNREELIRSIEKDTGPAEKPRESSKSAAPARKPEKKPKSWKPSRSR